MPFRCLPGDSWQGALCVVQALQARKLFGRGYSVLCETPACPAQWRVCEGEFTKRTPVAE
jgi:hypothetical protein